MNPATALDSAKHFAQDPFADIANHASAGDWNGAGVAYGHAEVGVAQVALAVSGVCEAVMADSCFLPSLADVVDLGEAASATSGADAGAGADPDVWNFPRTDVPATGRVIGSPDFEVPQNAWDTLDHLDQTGQAPQDSYQANPGVDGTYRNNDGQLPTTTSGGTPIKYNEWDVNPFTTTKARGVRRLVTGTDGSAWYTGTHYNRAPLGQNWIPMR
jgi:guanyl-specific ribonuclease Sa